MIQIYDTDQAARSILRRVPVNQMNVPAAVLAGTERLFGTGVTPSQAVAQIISSVRADGDQALQHWSIILDRRAGPELRVPPSAMQAALQALPDELRRALEVAAGRIRQFHQMQPLPNWETGTMGGTLGQRVIAVERVGVYVPGGTAPLPSSLLMSVIPAQVAGVRQVVVCTPPDPHPSILAAAALCGVQDLFEIGGAQAIAAMAFGTQSVPRMDKIVGAGNLWVTLAKQQVYGMVGLDGLAGPTETMIIADSGARPAWVAADLLAQAEHDMLASAILLTPDRRFATAVQVEVGRQMESLTRTAILEQSLLASSGIVITPDLPTAARLASDYAPEHLCLAVDDPDALLPLIRNAGGIFIGEHSFEVLGDYIAGPSHVMPTSGTARFASPLNVMDFVKITSMLRLDAATSQQLSPQAAIIARTEQLTAHAAAADFRRRGSDD